MTRREHSSSMRFDQLWSVATQTQATMPIEVMQARTVVFDGKTAHVIVRTQSCPYTKESRGPGIRTIDATRMEDGGVVCVTSTQAALLPESPRVLGALSLLEKIFQQE